jgi:hypothetical protein
MKHAKRGALLIGLAILETAGGCSRATRGPESPEPQASFSEAGEDASEAASAQAATTDAAAVDADHDPARSVPQIPGAHVLLLPYRHHDETPPPLVSLAAGEPPGGAFPAGTVYVAQSDEDGPAVTEWDLAKGTIRRKRKLVVPGDDANLRIRRIGHTLHVVAWSFNEDTRYVRLTLDLQQTVTHRLGSASAIGPGSIVGNADWTLVLFEGIPPGEPKSAAGGYLAFAFDAAGTPIAWRRLPGTRPLYTEQLEDAIVWNGDAYVVLVSRSDTGKRETYALRLGRTLNVERRLSLSKPDLSDVLTFEGIYAGRDDVWVKWADAPLMPAFASSGDRGPAAPPCEFKEPAAMADWDLWFSGEHVVFSGDRFDEWLEWTSRGTASAPTSPCPASVTGLRSAP